ncbi:hypothetical protein HV198_12520 [Citrobacter freundii]|uniref:hypothetical protein n=1 Tax=Citrobacter freundii TaxID=546 RepID=UPI0015E51026|nr:hypothetical protein [Citrobacter freundii]QLO42923.1 hypothetical protein HV215_12520 [Citrobacter freundii]QLV41087.1 hypothetical protein HV198_12520 [Citrobacter freundii]
MVKKYGVFFWRKGEKVEDVPSDKNVANSGVKPRRIFEDYIDGMRYAEKMNATVPANLKGKYEYVLVEVVEPDKNNTKKLFESGNLTEALKARRQSQDQINRHKIDAMIKEGIQEHLYKMTGVK